MDIGQCSKKSHTSKSNFEETGCASSIDNAVSRTIVSPSGTIQGIAKPQQLKVQNDIRDFVEWLAFYKSVAETIVSIFVEKHTRMPTEGELRQELFSFKEAMDSRSQDKYGREPTIAEAREVLKRIRQIADELQMVTIQGCSMTEFNGKYVVDYTRNNGWENGKRCYRKKGIFSASNNCTIHYRGDRFKYWALCKNYQWPVYYRNDSVANQPPKGGWVPYQEKSRSTPNKTVKVKTVRTARVGSKKRVSSKQKNQQIEDEWDALKLIRILLYMWITWKFLCSWCRSRNRRIQGRDIEFVCSSAFLISASLESFIQALT